MIPSIPGLSVIVPPLSEEFLLNLMDLCCGSANLLKPKTLKNLKEVKSESKTFWKCLPTFDMFLTYFPDLKKIACDLLFKGFLAGLPIHKTYDRNIQEIDWIMPENPGYFFLISKEFIRTWWAYDRDCFQKIDVIMTEDLRNKNERISKNLARYCRILNWNPWNQIMTPNPAKWRYHQKLWNSKKVLGCLVATNLQGNCWISGHLFLGISGISLQFSRNFL